MLSPKPGRQRTCSEATTSYHVALYPWWEGHSQKHLNNSYSLRVSEESLLHHWYCPENLFLSIGLPPVLPKSSGSLGIINPWAVFLLAPPLTTSGTITWENLAAVLPFGGTFDLIELKGSTLKKAFEHSVYRYGQSSGEFLQVGGKLLIWEFGDYCRLGPYTCTTSQPVSSISLPNISRAIHRELGQGLNTRALKEQNLPELQLKLFL